MAYLVRQNFTAGEISPRMAARFDMKKYHNSCKTLKNAIVLPHGPARRRMGTEYIAETFDSTKESRLVDFEFSETQAYALEFGEGYIRVFKDGGAIVKLPSTDWVTSTLYEVDDYVTEPGGTVQWCIVEHTSGTYSTDKAAGKWTDSTAAAAIWITATSYVVHDLVSESGIIYRCLEDHTSGTFATDLAAAKWIADGTYAVATTYDEDELFELSFCQSADTLFIVHQDHAPAILTRTAHTAWTLTDIDFEVEPSAYNYNGYTLDASATTGSITLTASTGFFTTGFVGAKFYLHNGMVVVDSYTSATVVDATVTAQRTTADYWATGVDYVVGDWVTETTTIYKCIVAHTSGTFATDLSANKWIADGNLSVHTATAEWEEGEWSARRGYPTCVNFFEQRLCFAATSFSPQTIWGSKSADYYDFGISSPLADDDAVTYTISSDQVNVIRWLSPSSVLAIGTIGGEWILSGGNNDVVTPTSVKVVRQSTHGCERLQPVMVGAIHLFLQRQGRTVREFRYSFEQDAFESVDLSIISEHLTRSNAITDWAYQQVPNSIIWMVRDDGDLLGLTYLRQHEVVGWHHHDTQGEFESVATIPGDNQDEVWAIVKRNIDGADVRYVERMYDEFNPSGTDPTAAKYIDCGASYSGSATSTITGLAHLEDELVSTLGDGAVVPDATVASGSLTLQNDVEAAHIGLSYDTDIEPNAIELVSDDVTTMGRLKSIIAANISVVESNTMEIGLDFDNLNPVVFRKMTDDLGQYVPLADEVKRQLVTQTYEKEATVCIRQSDPLPLTVRGVTYEVEVNK